MINKQWHLVSRPAGEPALAAALDVAMAEIGALQLPHRIFQLAAGQVMSVG